mgnify:CR=1 FL=1
MRRIIWEQETCWGPLRQSWIIREDCPIESISVALDGLRFSIGEVATAAVTDWLPQAENGDFIRIADEFGKASIVGIEEAEF